ncbi:hypothetical protein PPSQR21_033190 [Paenibacillus polymyxa SQR-21]|nr:hypothetical protein [Paenibacillus polymyxa]AHM66958.1 hypothetical protein PPSQR21_033190 [Paenibacillus polymyxa SQR-21]
MNTKKILLSTAMSLGLIGGIIIPSASAAVGPSPEITPLYK